MSANKRHMHILHLLGLHKSKAVTNQIVALFSFMPLLAAALLSFMLCTACSGSPHNATHSASLKVMATLQFTSCLVGFVQYAERIHLKYDG